MWLISIFAVGIFIALVTPVPHGARVIIVGSTWLVGIGIGLRFDWFDPQMKAHLIGLQGVAYLLIPVIMCIQFYAARLLKRLIGL